MRSQQEIPTLIRASRGPRTKAWQRALSLSPQSTASLSQGHAGHTFAFSGHLGKQSPAGKHNPWAVPRVGRRKKGNEALPCTEGNSEVKPGGLWEGFLSFPQWWSPGEGLQGEGAVFFFCPNKLMKFGSGAGGIEISSRYTVCLCLINVNLPRARLPIHCHVQTEQQKPTALF